MFSFGARRKQLNQWVEILAKGSLLGGLDRRTIYRLLKHTRHQTVEAGDVLMRQGDEGDSAYFVLVGELGVQAAGQPHFHLTLNAWLLLSWPSV